MLVLSRKRGQSIVIDGQVKVTISEVHGSRVKLVIEAPRSRQVMRFELTPDGRTSQPVGNDQPLSSAP